MLKFKTNIISLLLLLGSFITVIMGKWLIVSQILMFLAIAVFVTSHIVRRLG
jgi:hypothetical protein